MLFLSVSISEQSCRICCACILLLVAAGAGAQNKRGGIETQEGLATGQRKAAQAGSRDRVHMISLGEEILEQRGEVILDLYTADPAQLKTLLPWLSLDHPVEGGWRIYADRRGYEQLLSTDISFGVVPPPELTPGIAGNTSEFPGDWDRYPTHPEYENAMLRLAEAYPEICRLDTIGRSVAGREILAMKITDDPGLEEGEPVCYYSSSMHGDELSGYVLMIRLIDHLCGSYGLDARITRLVDSLEIWINPLANPDGAYYDGGDTINSPKRFNLNNVDLNRGFPDIRQPEPADYQIFEPENRGQMRFMKRVRPHLSANFHEGQEVVNYPYDTWSQLHADDAWFRRISRRYADSAQARSFPVAYMQDLDNGITNGWAWYQVVGSRQDWITWFQQGREVTVEISREKFPDPAILPFYWYYQQVSMLEYLEQALYGIHGRVRSLDSGKPLFAEIRVAGHDTLNAHVFTDSLSGRFTRLIDTGLWDIVIIAEGYDRAVLPGIRVDRDTRTWLDIGLRRQSPTNAPPLLFETYPNPFQSGTRISFIPPCTGRYLVEVFNTAGQQMYRRMIHATADQPVDISLDLDHIPPGMFILQLCAPERSHRQLIYKLQ